MWKTQVMVRTLLIKFNGQLNEEITEIYFFSVILDNDKEGSILYIHSWQKKVVTPPLKTIKPMWIELFRFHLAEIGIIWTRDYSPTKSDTTLDIHSMQGQVGSSSSETTVYVVVPPNQSSHCDNFESIFAYFFKSFSDCSNNAPSNPYGY